MESASYMLHFLLIQCLVVWDLTEVGGSICCHWLHPGCGD